MIIMGCGRGGNYHSLMAIILQYMNVYWINMLYILKFYNVICQIYFEKRESLYRRLKQHNKKNCFLISHSFSTILEMFYHFLLVLISLSQCISKIHCLAGLAWVIWSTSASRNDPTQAKCSKSLRYGNCQAEVHCTLRILLAAGIWEAATESWIKESLWKHRF